jgi:large subunit ribosomal protein L34e
VAYERSLIYSTMAGDHRVTNPTKHSYRTATNRIKTVRAPGGRYIAKFQKKHQKGVLCGEAGCDKALPGIKHMKNQDFKQLAKRDRRVSRAYGGSLCGECVKKRVVRAFLLEEVKLAKRVMMEKKRKSKA